ncbi:MAG: GAF domain-containing protein [Endomicrobium sp.]|jgi:HD-GYP domain-containing protein (c-di-GMP phosphodiesterase class II)|nr:GAF domain-containing protein [Endomicrobium sp.]
MNDVLLSVSVVLFLLLIVWTFRIRRKLKETEEDYAKETELLKTKLSENSVDADNLMNMLTGLHEFGMSVSGIGTQKELAESVVNIACKLTSAQAGSLMFIDKDINDLYILAAKGLPEDVVKVVRIKLGENISGKVAQTGKPIFVEDIEADIRFLRPNSNERYETKSFVSVPLRGRNKIIGVLNINAAREIKSFDDRDIRLLTILADQSAMLFDNLELYKGIQGFYFEMINTLARMIDAKDSYTHDHADRAYKYAIRIAQNMKLPEAIMTHIGYAALMHDIGKIGIEETILKKQGKLTPEETVIIKQHPQIGNKIIAPVTFLAPIAPMVLYHQEWYNGNGYPEGLAGEEIPLGARIVAVIDSYDAMTSDRPYRKSLSQEYAIDELKRGAGTQFDPNIVNIFIDILQNEKKAQSQNQNSNLN